MLVPQLFTAQSWWSSRSNFRQRSFPSLCHSVRHLILAWFWYRFQAWKLNRNNINTGIRLRRLFWNRYTTEQGRAEIFVPRVQTLMGHSSETWKTSLWSLNHDPPQAVRCLTLRAINPLPYDLFLHNDRYFVINNLSKKREILGIFCVHVCCIV